jgi:hypothetical protein
MQQGPLPLDLMLVQKLSMAQCELVDTAAALFSYVKGHRPEEGFYCDAGHA